MRSANQRQCTKKKYPPAAKKDPAVTPGVGVPAVGGSGLMTTKEIVGYMRAHGYVNGAPRRDPKVAQDLIAQIKRRGGVSRLEVGKDDLQCFAENQANYGVNDVVKASSCNLGTPTTISWLPGKWIMYVIGGVIDTAPGDGYIHRRNESIGKLGFLSISPNGTYTWKVNPSDPPAKYVKGSWRKATEEEMGLQGGAGIVLQKAAEGADWIVFKYMDPFKKTERIEVEHIQYRGAYRRIGWRE